MVNKDLKFKKVKDKSDKLTKVDKGILGDLPLRALLVGRTGSGKTSAIISLLCDSRFYKNDFEGENIYLFSPMVNDKKMEMLVEKKKIPCINIFTEFDDEILNQLYEQLVEDFQEEEALGAKKVLPKLIILDDLSFDGSLRKGLFNAVSRVFCNGRKHGISIFVTSQYYSHNLPVCRFNANFLILFNMNEKELDKITDEHNFLGNRNKFKDLMRTQLNEQHDFVVINYTNSRLKGLYMNSNFEKIA